MESALDQHDLLLLALLQDNARLTNVELSEKVHLSPSQISRRLQRLIDEKFIVGFHAELNPRRVGIGVHAYCLVTLKAHNAAQIREFHDRLRKSPLVMNCDSLTGEADYLLKIVAADLKAFSEFISETLIKSPEVAHVRTSIVLENIKHKTDYPLSHPGKT